MYKPWKRQTDHPKSRSMRLKTSKETSVKANVKHLIVHQDATFNLRDSAMIKRILRASLFLMPVHGAPASRWGTISFEVQVN